LKDHAAIGTRADDGTILDQHLAAGGGELRRETGDQPQNGALAATAGPQHANKLAPVWQICDGKIDVSNCGKRLRRTFVVRLADVLKLHDSGNRNIIGRAYVI
jgi:hypothetical protein